MDRQTNILITILELRNRSHGRSNSAQECWQSVWKLAFYSVAAQVGWLSQNSTELVTSVNGLDIWRRHCEHCCCYHHRYYLLLESPQSRSHDPLFVLRLWKVSYVVDNQINPYIVKINEHVKYLGTVHLVQKLSSETNTHTHTHTHKMDCSTCINKVAGNNTMRHTFQFQLAVATGMCRNQLKSKLVRFGFCISNQSDSNSDSDLSHDHS